MCAALEGNAELAPEEVGSDANGDKCNTRGTWSACVRTMYIKTKYIHGEREVETIGEGVCEDLDQVPVVRRVRRKDTVDGQGHDGTIVEQGNNQDHEGREVKLEGEGKNGEAEDNTNGDSTGVDGVVPHTLEDDTGSADSMDDGGKTRLRQDDIGSTTSSVSGTLDGDTDVGTGKSGGIVGTITSHGTQVTKTLETLDNLVLVLGEDTSETIGIENHLVEGVEAASGLGTVLEHLSGVHVVAETETTTGFLRNSELVTGNHLDAKTESGGIVDRLLGIVTRGSKMISRPISSKLFPSASKSSPSTSS